MRWRVLISFGLLLFTFDAFSQSNRATYFNQLHSLEFDEAKRLADLERDSLLRNAMIRLADILYYEGQTDISKFHSTDSVHATGRTDLLVFSFLCEGYKSLFYDAVKGNAYKHFYKAYRYAKESTEADLIKACLLGLLKYYNYEIAQNSEAHLPYLRHLSQLRTTRTDSVWTCIYEVIFLSKTMVPLQENYFNQIDQLDKYQRQLAASSPLRAHIYYEKALRAELEKNILQAKEYYHQTIAQSKDYPFLRYHRFFSAIKLMRLHTNSSEFDSARLHRAYAAKEIDISDTLRSVYYLNLYSSFLYRAEKKYDSAFNMLWDAYQKEFHLDFRRNTLEINRLNVELDTQEKENANLRLRQGRIWLLVAVAGFALLSVVIYFAYSSQVARNKVQQKEREVQNMKLDKLLKDQEMLGIDAMLEGQEKERQRLAEDLHDHLGSLLAAIKFHFASFKAGGEKGDTEEVLKSTDALLEEAYQQVRTIAHFRNVGMDPAQGLLPAIHSFASKASVLNRLKVEVEAHGLTDRIDNTLELLIFRIVQELIANVIKHAQATEIVIHLTRHEESLNLMVEDNGVGFNVSVIKPGETMGLYSIQKKIEQLGGSVTIDSIAGRGTNVIIDIPLT
jgi:signal transduction histidine kinase